MKDIRKKTKKSLTSIMVICFMLVFGAAIGTSLYSQKNMINELKQKEAVLLSEIEEEEEKSGKLKTQQDYYESDAYIEKVAREQLGYVKPDEIVFKNSSNKGS